MRVRHGLEGALSRLADFMNVLDSALTRNQWERWRLDQEKEFQKHPNEDIGMPLPLQVSVEEAKGIREELHQVLWAMCAGPHHLPEEIGKDLMDKFHMSTSTLIGVILSKLQALPFDWVHRRVDIGGVLIKRGGKKERWVVESIPMNMDARTALYYILAEAIRLGAITTFKLCPSAACSKYFVTKDPRQNFCTPSCRYTFNNHQRKARKDKRKESQTIKREDALRKARRLRDEGKSQRVLKKETGLSDRVIETIFEEL